MNAKANPLAAITSTETAAVVKQAPKAKKAAKAVVAKVKAAAKAKVAEVHAAAAVKKAAKVKAEKPAAEKAVRITKKDLATAIMKNNPGATRKTIMQMFMEELGFSAAHANTYYYNVKASI